MIKRIIYIVLYFFVIQTTFGRHIKGGWMYYEYLGQSPVDPSKARYNIVLKVYRDCSPPSQGQNDAVAPITVFKNNIPIVVTTLQAPQTRIYTLDKHSFSTCIQPIPSVCYVVLEYQTTVDLDTAGSGYTLSYQRCCRIDGIINVQPPSNVDGNTYTITIPGSVGNVDNYKNSSPQFAEKDTAVVCFNSPITLDYSAVDPDEDSLVYLLAPAIVGATAASPAPTQADPPPYVSISYQAPFSFADPFATGIKINSKTGIITGNSPSTTGEYVLAVIIKEYRKGVFIAETRKELHVLVNACSLVAAQLPLQQITCNGFDMTFENQSLSPAIHSYFWDFGVKSLANDTSILPQPTYSYPDTGVFTAKLIVNKGEECTDSATTEVRVFPGFFPDFSFSGACKGIPFQFTDNSTTKYGIVDSWRWNFGDLTSDADTSHIINPQYAYPDTGQKTVELIVSSSKGCVDTTYKKIIVYDKPILKLPFHDTLICSIDTLPLIALGTGTFTWTPNVNIKNANTSNPLVWPKDTVVYYVRLDDRGCINNDSIKVNVLDFITVDAGPDSIICRTDAIVLRPISDALSYQWSPNIALNNSSIKNPIAQPITPTITYYVTANLGKCQDRDSIVIRTVPYPQANAGNDTTVCFGESINLNGTIVGSSFSWSPATILSNPKSLNTKAFPKDTTFFILTATDTVGCPKPVNDTLIARVVPPVKVFAGNDTTVVIGQPLVFTANASSFVTQYQWSPITAILNPNILQAQAIYNVNTLPPNTDEITYTLRVSTPQGCAATDDITVKIFKVPPSLFVPNAFTPNGDGKNDVIRPIAVGMQRLNYFRVYNRYGQLIYETSEMGKGWDGRINGQLQNSSSFVYDVQAIDFNGKIVKASGTFTLIR